LNGRLNRRVVLAARPAGIPKLSDFSLDAAPLPEPADGEFLIEASYLSADPLQRWRMEERTDFQVFDARIYRKAVAACEASGQPSPMTLDPGRIRLLASAPTLEALGGFHGASYHAGTALGKAVIFGRIAGRSAARRVLSA
jgi:hypothetical protein